MTRANDLLLSMRQTTDGIGRSEQQVAAAVVETLQETNTAIRGLAPVESNAGASIAELQKATIDIEALANDEDLKQSLANLNSTTRSVSGMASDTQKYWHSVLYPSWPKRIWSMITGVGLDAAKLFVP